MRLIVLLVTFVEKEQPHSVGETILALLGTTVESEQVRKRTSMSVLKATIAQRQQHQWVSLKTDAFKDSIAREEQQEN
jgi:hypothetical protein